MANDGSVAPKERVNIVYQTDINGLEEDVELPLKILVTGEFLTKDENNSLEERKKIKVNNKNFNDIMSAQELSLNFNVSNKLSKNEDEDLSIDLSFNNIKDFEPDSIVNNVPELKKLMELREALKALKGPLGNIPEFRKKIDSIIQDEDTKNKLLEELQIRD